MAALVAQLAAISSALADIVTKVPQAKAALQDLATFLAS